MRKMCLFIDSTFPSWGWHRKPLWHQRHRVSGNPSVICEKLFLQREYLAEIWNLIKADLYCTDIICRPLASFSRSATPFEATCIAQTHTHTHARARARTHTQTYTVSIWRNIMFLIYILPIWCNNANTWHTKNALSSSFITTHFVAALSVSGISASVYGHSELL